jgi:beta-glucanase (GH16 family)
MNIIRKGLLLIFIACSTMTVWGQKWELVWSDEFDGESLDMANWSYQTGTGSEYGLTNWGNNELQYYREENVVVGDSVLTIIAKEEDYGGKSYTSGRIRTVGKGDWTYCRIEFRAKMPLGQGLWAAIWMMPTDSEYGGWAASGEIDIMEYLGHEPMMVHGTLHFGGQWPYNVKNGESFTSDSGSFAEAFHDFVFEWEEGIMRWYVDDMRFQAQAHGDWWTEGQEFPAPFDKRFHLLFNLAVGGNWPKPPDETTEFPQELVVDYVRIYQKQEPNGLGNIPGKAEFLLGQNVPNPVMSHTTITYSIPAQQHVILEVFDPLGRRVQTLVDGIRTAGTHQVALDAADLPPGIYTYRIQAGSYSGYRQMILL